MEEKDIKKVERIIGYTFKDKVLLERALTHGSASKNALENYQSLDVFGGQYPCFIVAKRLMEINPNAHEGTLTRIRATIVSREPLAEEVKKLGLENFLIVGKGENVAYISSQAKIMSDLFESMIAAIYLDSKSIDVAEKFILSKLADLFNGKCKHFGEDDYKSKLNDLHLATMFPYTMKKSNAPVPHTIRPLSSK